MREGAALSAVKVDRYTLEESLYKENKLAGPLCLLSEEQAT